ncbi:MAG: hypothetical protein J6K55_11260 [Clostridia bacterium]|nr:hypothetical protein [Clostridia bacterium]
MYRRFRWMVPWLVGALTAAVLFVGLAAVGGLRYENSDDMLFVKGFMGFEGGTPVSFTLYTHTFLAWILYGLSTALPGIAWFSVFQLGLLWLSAAVTVKSAIRLGSWKGFIGSGLYLGVFAAFACARLSYTTTAALAGAAAVMQLMELEKTKTRTGRMACLFWACALFLGAYSLRQMTALPILAYCLLSLTWYAARRIRDKRSIRPVVMACAVLCGLLAVFAGVREWEITARGERDTLKWQQSRIELFDYTSFEQDAAPAVQSDSGLTDLQTQLVQQWYFWDTDVDREAFDAMRQAYNGEPKAGVFKKLGDFLRSSPRYGYAIVFLLILSLWIFLGDDKSRLSSIAALLALLGGLVMLIYLCWRGRVLFRGLDTVFFPCGATLLALALRTNLPQKKLVSAVLCAALALTAGMDALLTLDVLDEKPDSISQQREAELEVYALKNPDRLIVRTPNLLRDTRLMPDVSAGIPINTAIWGDWYCRMPGWRQQLEHYGFDTGDFHLSDWADSALVFATNEDAPPQLLVDGIAESLGQSVVYEKIGTEGTLSFFAFHAE